MFPPIARLYHRMRGCPAELSRLQDIPVEIYVVVKSVGIVSGPTT